MTATPQRATTLADAYWSLDPFAAVYKKHPFFVDLTEFFPAHEYGVGPFLERHLGAPGRSRGFHHLGIVGQRGSGKTTQVHDTLSRLSGIRPVFVDALQALDQADFTFADLLLIIVRRVLEELQVWGITQLPRAEAELVHQWFSEVLVSKVQSDQILAEIGTTVEGGHGIPFLAKLTAKVTAALKSSSDYRKEIRQRALRDIDDLVRRTNQLLDAAERLLGADTGVDRSLVIVFDNLEKLPDRRQVADAVLRRADHLASLRTHLILFFDTSDQYAPVAIQPTEAFTTHVVPMLPVRTKTQPLTTVSEEMARATERLLDARIDLDRLTTDKKRLVIEIARLSGGRLRDIFHLTRKGVEYAAGSQLSPNDLERGAIKLSGERNVLARNDQWPRLRQIHVGKQVARDDGDGFLLQHSLVLNYNGEPWWDVHPLVTLDARFAPSA